MVVEVVVGLERVGLGIFDVKADFVGILDGACDG